MEYRKLPRREEQISVIGLGGGSLPEDIDKAAEAVSAAIDNGINFFDLAPSCQPPFYAFAKAFAGGQLLDEKTSLFGRALTHTQCIQYALDRPAVLTVLPGVRSLEDLQTALHYVDSTPGERDYSVIGEFTPKSAEGVCVYCNHCQPCPKSLNVGLINKYYDLALAGDQLAKGHYEKLPLHASDCVKCGHCESRCPFHVKQEARMEEIAGYFGK